MPFRDFRQLADGPGAARRNAGGRGARPRAGRPAGDGDRGARAGFGRVRLLWPARATRGRARAGRPLRAARPRCRDDRGRPSARLDAVGVAEATRMAAPPGRRERRAVDAGSAVAGAGLRGRLDLFRRRGTGGRGLRAFGVRGDAAAPRRRAAGVRRRAADRVDRPRRRSRRPAASAARCSATPSPTSTWPSGCDGGAWRPGARGPWSSGASTTRRPSRSRRWPGSCARSTRRSSTATLRPAGGKPRHEGARSQPRASDLLDRRRPGRVLQPLHRAEGARGLGGPLSGRGGAARRPARCDAADVARPRAGRDAVLVRRLRLAEPRQQPDRAG